MWAYIKFATLINITANKEILPEFTQFTQKNVKNIHKKAQEWLENPEEIWKVRQEMNVELEKFKSANQPSEVIIANL